MNNTFDFARFQRLFVKHTVEHYRAYLMKLLVLSGLGATLYAFVLLTGGVLHTSVRLYVASFIYILSGCIFTSSIFSELGQKQRAIAALTFPASHFEKFMVAWTYSYIIYTLAFSVSFAIVDYSFAAIAPSYAQNRYLMSAISENELPILFMIYSLLHSCALLGAVYFDKLHFVKTALCFFALICSVTLFHQLMLKILFSNADVLSNSPIMAASLTIQSNATLLHNIRIPEPEKIIYYGILVVGMTVAFWASSFFRIKEKQI